MSLFNTGIRPVVDKWLLDKAAEKRDYGDYWSASSAGYCMRKVIFERLGVPPVTEDARKQRVFSSGDIFHEWVQEITKEAGLSIAQELELQDEELMIRGHIDDLVLVQADIPLPIGSEGPQEIDPKPHLILYDYKTQNSRAFSYKHPEMSHYHKMQLGTYMYMLRNQDSGWLPPDGNYVFRGENLTEARILKISKDDLRMVEEQLLWTNELEKEVYSYWDNLNAWWENRKIPPCTCNDYEIITNQKNPDFGKGFMATQKYNPYFYKGNPCSLDYYKEWRAKNDNQSS